MRRIFAWSAEERLSLGLSPDGAELFALEPKARILPRNVIGE